MGNRTALRVVDGQVQIGISPEPVYLLTRRPVSALLPGEPVHAGPPTERSFLVSALDDLAEWTVEAGRSQELELYDFTCPRRPGDFLYRELVELAGQTGAIEVTPKLPVAGSPYLPMYSVLAHRAGVEIPGEPTGIGLMVHGNGGWGRIIFELQDASGQRWISLGCEQQGTPTRWLADWLPANEFSSLGTSGLCDWNTDDAWGWSHINFEGWRFLRFPLPGNYPGEPYHWPYSSQWRFSGDGVVHYPLTFRRLVITIPEKVLRFRDWTPVPRPQVSLRALMVTYAPPASGLD
jgi:hypothetical protein